MSFQASQKTLLIWPRRLMNLPESRITIQERAHLNSKSVAKGYYAPDAKAIVIQSGLPDSEKLKVRLHEWAMRCWNISR